MTQSRGSLPALEDALAHVGALRGRLHDALIPPLRAMFGDECSWMEKQLFECASATERLAAVRSWIAVASRVAPTTPFRADVAGQEVGDPPGRRRTPALRYETVGRALGPSINPRGDVRRVLYPAGSVDLVGALRLFAGPRGAPSELCIVDLVPFGTPAQVVGKFADAKAYELLRRDQATLGYACVDAGHSLDAVGCAGPALLWQLAELGATGVRVTYLDVDGQPAAPPSTPRRVQGGPATIVPPPATKEVSTARIEATIDGRPVTITYVEGDLCAVARGGRPNGSSWQLRDWQGPVQPAYESDAMPGALREFLAAGPDAVLVKAACGLEEGARSFMELAGARLRAGGVWVAASWGSDAVATLLGLSPRPVPNGSPSVGYGQVQVYEKPPAR